MRIDLRASTQLAALLAGVHCAGAGLLIHVVPLEAWVVAVCCLIAIDALWTIRRHALLQHGDAVVGFELAGEDECALQLRNGERVVTRVLPSTYVTPWLVVLNLEISQQRVRRHVVIWCDSLPADILRRVRVRLRWARLDEPQHGRTEAPL